MTPRDLTVIIPTFNRLRTLKLCLRALEAQTASGFEVIVVDDGSTDGTMDMLQAFQHGTPLHVRLLRQANAGPATARNLALAHTATDLGLLIGDDILATPTLVEAHLEFHRQHPQPSHFALGWTYWDDRHQAVTPFMRWYEDMQFDYRRLLAGSSPTWQHAYTSNLSFKTQALRDNLFDERFRAAAWEDTELAFRLDRKHMFHLTFLPSAKASHVHPTTFARAVRRAQTLGQAARLFHTIQPEARDKQAADFASRLCFVLERAPGFLHLLTALVTRLPSPGIFHSMVLRAHQQRAYRKALGNINFPSG